MNSWTMYLRNRSVPVRVAGLAGVTLLVFAIVGPVAFGLGGSMALVAAGLAAVVCFSGALTALLASHALASPSMALAALLTGMIARMAIPLACGLAVHLRGGTLSDAGFLYYLLVFYPVTLAVETLFSMLAQEPFQAEGATTSSLQVSKP